MTGGRATIQLSRRFYLIVVLSLVTLGTGMATGYALFYRLLYVLILTGVLSYLWSWLTMRSMEVTVHRRARQVSVGDSVEEEITVRNLSALPKHALEVQDTTDLPVVSTGMVVGLRGGSSGWWRIQTTPRTRGVYTLGPLRVSNVDPFGIFRRERYFGDKDTLTVFPRAFDLPGFKVPAADIMGDSSIRRRTHIIAPHASTVREYEAGDSLSRVHWNTTARMGKLMSKEFDLGRAAEIWVLLDLHGDVRAGELEESTDEYGASVAASLARRYVGADLPVGLLAYGDQRYFLPAETGSSHLERVLFYLAMARAEGDTPLGVVLPKEELLWTHQSSLVVITSSPNPEWVVALGELSKRGIKVLVVLIDGESFGGDLDASDVIAAMYSRGLSTHVVRRGEDIPTALSRLDNTSVASEGVRLEEVLSTG